MLMLSAIGGVMTGRTLVARFWLTAAVLAAIGLTIFAMVCGIRTRRPWIEPRHVTKRRVPYNAAARHDPPGTVGIMIAFVPQNPPPIGGWTMDTKLLVSAAPEWITANKAFAVDRAFGAIGVNVGPGLRRAGGASILPDRVGAFAVRGTSRVEELATLRASLEARPGFLGLFNDPPLVSDQGAATCGRPVSSTAYDVVAASQDAPVPNPNPVLLVVVDAGLSQDTLLESAWYVNFDATLSYSASAALGPPLWWPGDEHGNMVAYDATLLAPNITLVDIRTADPFKERLSDAENAFNVLYARFKSDPTIKNRYAGMVVANSWAMSEPDTQSPDSERYYNNSNHPFTQLVQKFIDDDIDVVFAAGNSGVCPVETAIAGSVWGANSLGGVISVGAVDIDKLRYGGSSQGPGAIATQKPDIVSYTWFVGADDGLPDTGTSASAALVAGMVAAIRSSPGWGWSNKHPQDVRQRLIDTADKNVLPGGGSLTGWNAEFGNGIARMK